MAFNLVLKIAAPKQKRENYKKTKLTEAICIIDNNGEFKAKLLQNIDTFKANSVFSFTEDSYNLENKRIVFTHNKDERGNIVQVIRDKIRAKWFPGIKSQYTPFYKDYIMKGNIVEIKGKHYFKFKRLVGKGEYKIDKNYFNDEEW
jgi:hypothetical protein